MVWRSGRFQIYEAKRRQARPVSIFHQWQAPFLGGVREPGKATLGATLGDFDCYVREGATVPCSGVAGEEAL